MNENQNQDHIVFTDARRLQHSSHVLLVEAPGREPVVFHGRSIPGMLDIVEVIDIRGRETITYIMNLYPGTSATRVER